MNRQHHTIDLDDWTRPDIVTLLQAGEEYGTVLYPKESTHFLPIKALEADNIIFISACDSDHRNRRTGNLQWLGRAQESVVIPEARGKGISRLLLIDLENRARNARAVSIRLETGIANTEALGLYN